MITIVKNGKSVLVDLSKIATWIDIPPEDQKLVRTSKEISDVLAEIRGPRGEPLQEHIIVK